MFELKIAVCQILFMQLITGAVLGYKHKELRIKVSNIKNQYSNDNFVIMK